MQSIPTKTRVFAFDAIGVLALAAATGVAAACALAGVTLLLAGSGLI